MKLHIMCIFRGVSSFVAFTVLLAISSAIAIYIYTYSTSLYSVYRPKQSYIYGYVVCYNVSGLETVLLRNVTLCRSSLNGFSDSRYLCVFRIGLRVNLTIVYRDYLENLFINRSCIALLRDLPLKVFRSDGDMLMVFEVKVYDPWSK
jgi:hypothetical protein